MIQTKESVVILAHFACFCSLPVPVQMGGAESLPASANPQDGDAPQLALAAIEHNAANDLEKIIREFWQNRGAEGPTVQKEPIGLLEWAINTINHHGPFNCFAQMELEPIPLAC